MKARPLSVLRQVLFLPFVKNGKHGDSLVSVVVWRRSTLRHDHRALYWSLFVTLDQGAPWGNQLAQSFTPLGFAVIDYLQKVAGNIPGKGVKSHYDQD